MAADLTFYSDTPESAIVCAMRAGYDCRKARAVPAVKRGEWLVEPVGINGRETTVGVSLGGHGERTGFRVNLVDLME